MRLRRSFALAAAALGLALGATGCSFMNPVQTHEFYQAADGTNANINQGGELAVGARNMLVLVGPDGSAQLLGSVANYTTDEVTVELEGSDNGTVAFSTSVSVPAGGVVTLGDGEDQQLAEIGQLDVEPGAVMDLKVTGADGEAVITIPVLDDTLDHYKQ